MCDFNDLQVGTGFAIQGSMELRLQARKLKRTTLHGLFIVLLLAGFSSHYSAGPRLFHVDDEVRLNYAEKFWGHGKDVIANIQLEDGALENFIFQTFKNDLRSEKGKFSPYDVANTVIRHSNHYGLDPLFIMAVVQQESRFNADAKGQFGEIGLMQIKPDTAAWICNKFGIPYSGPKDLYNPIKNIEIGTLYLAWLDSRYDSAHHAVAAYNMGGKNLKLSLARRVLPTEYYSGIVQKYATLYARVMEPLLVSVD